MRMRALPVFLGTFLLFPFLYALGQTDCKQCDTMHAGNWKSEGKVIMDETPRLAYRCMINCTGTVDKDTFFKLKICDHPNMGELSPECHRAEMAWDKNTQPHASPKARDEFEWSSLLSWSSLPSVPSLPSVLSLPSVPSLPSTSFTVSIDPLANVKKSVDNGILQVQESIWSNLPIIMIIGCVFTLIASTLIFIFLGCTPCQLANRCILVVLVVPPVAGSAIVLLSSCIPVPTFFLEGSKVALTWSAPIWVIVFVVLFVVRCSATWNLYTVFYYLTSTQTQTETPITTPITTPTRTPNKTPTKPQITNQSQSPSQTPQRGMQWHGATGHMSAQVPNGQQRGFGFGYQHTSDHYTTPTRAQVSNGQSDSTPCSAQRRLVHDYPTHPTQVDISPQAQVGNSPQASAEQSVNSPPAPGNGSVEVQVKKEQHKRLWSEISKDEIDNMDLIELQETCAAFEVPVKKNYNKTQLRNALKKQKLALEIQK